MTDSLSAYKQQVLNDFNNRPDYENEFHKQAATRLVELAKVRSGQLVLDIATGKGLAAIAAAEAVGSAGSVLGTDFASGMLRQAQQKIGDLGLTNIEFEEADADEQQFEESQFDAILYSSAIVSNIALWKKKQRLAVPCPRCVLEEPSTKPKDDRRSASGAPI
jgi:ubiquinone/menaquinone biosynthesis C-methylase UbiE